jgi:8-oxo-dGTP pyrophosphatase MutT (NUDIX family)
MVERTVAEHPARTLLEQQIRARRQTFEEFAEYVDQFARDHNEPGTISIRHLQRLAAGQRFDGKPLGPVRPTTARLLEGIFGVSIHELLAPPVTRGDNGEVPTTPTAQSLRVAIAVVVKDAEVLMVRPRGEVGSGISWQFPAGIVKPGVPPETVAVRETLEETGVHSVVVRRLGSRVHPTTNVLCSYLLCDYVAGDATNADLAENAGVAWVNKANLTRFVPAGQIYRPVLGALGSPKLTT